MRKLLAVAASLAICMAFAACTDSEPVRQGIGEVERVDDVAGTPIARALGLEVHKFDFSLRYGHYDVEVWLEQDDIESSEPVRLTSGKGIVLKEIDGGSVVLGISDPAATAPDKGKNWRVVISTYFGEDEKIGDSTGTFLIPHPFHDLSERSTAPANKQVIRNGKELVLVTWAGGDSVQVPDGPARNERIVYLKMKVTPLEEPVE